MSNQFYIVLRGQGQAQKWDIQHPLQDVGHPLEGGYPWDLQYFGGILAEVDRRIPDKNLKFYVTWDPDHAPATGDTVVIILIGDERYQLPAYATKVLAIFKTGGARPFYPTHLLKRPGLFTLLETARAARNTSILLKRMLLKHFGPGGYKKVYPLPIGHYVPVTKEPLPMDARPFDVSFAGNTAGKKDFPITPKQYSRHRLLKGLTAIAAQRPELKIFPPMQKIGADFGLSFEDYATLLVQSKICLCPRGNFIETWRLFEAARAGCVLVTETLPDLWYFRDCPAITLEHWDDLQKVLDGLLKNQEQLKNLSRASKDWYQKSISEEAAGQYIATILSDIIPPGTP